MLRFDYQPAPDAVGLQGYPLLDNHFHYWADMYGEETWDWSNEMPEDFDNAIIASTSVELPWVSGLSVWNLDQNSHGFLLMIGLNPGVVPVAADMAGLAEKLGMPVSVYAYQERVIEHDSYCGNTGKGDHLIFTAFFNTLDQIPEMRAAESELKALGRRWGGIYS